MVRERVVSEEMRGSSGLTTERVVTGEKVSTPLRLSVSLDGFERVEPVPSRF